MGYRQLLSGYLAHLGVVNTPHIRRGADLHRLASIYSVPDIVIAASCRHSRGRLDCRAVQHQVANRRRVVDIRRLHRVTFAPEIITAVLPASSWRSR